MKKEVSIFNKISGNEKQSVTRQNNLGEKAISEKQTFHKQDNLYLFFIM